MLKFNCYDLRGKSLMDWYSEKHFYSLSKHKLFFRHFFAYCLAPIELEQKETHAFILYLHKRAVNENKNKKQKANLLHFLNWNANFHILIGISAIGKNTKYTREKVKLD